MPVVGAIGSVVQGGMGARAAGQASNAEIQAQNDSMAMQMAMYQQTRADNTPRRLIGDSAYNQLAALFGLPQQSAANGEIQTTFAPGRKGSGMTDHLRDTIIPFDDGEFQSPFIGFGDWTGGFEDQPGRNTYSFGGGTGPQIHPEKPAEPAADPRIAAQNAFQQFRDSTGYQFRLGEGQKGLERSAAARGGLLSGAAIKAAADYGQNTASGEFGNYFNYLMNIANGGQSALNNTGQAGQNFASGAANAYGNIGNAMSSGYTNQANAWGNAMNGVGTAFGDWYRGSQAGNRADTTSPTGQVTGWV